MMSMLPGRNGFAQLGASFIQPVLAATVAVQFIINGWIPGAGSYISGAAGVYFVTASNTSGAATLQLIEYRAAIQGDTVLQGETFGAAGERGAQGYGTAKNSASFVQPSLGTTVDVTFDSTRWVPNESGLVLSCAWGVYEVVAVTGPANVIAMRLLEVRGGGIGSTLGFVVWGAAGQRGQAGTNGTNGTNGGAVVNAEAILASAVSTTSGLESTLHTVSFVAPASGAVLVFGQGSCSFSQNNVELEVYLDVSGVAGARVPNMLRGNSSALRESFSPFLRVAGLTPGNTYSARIRWRASSGTRVCDVVGDPKHACRITVVNAA